MPIVLSFAQGLLDLAAAEARRRPDLARRALRTAAGLPEHAAAAWRALAELHEQEGNSAAARESWREVLARIPDDGPAHAALARLLDDDRRWSDALTHRRRANEAGLTPNAAEEGLRMLRAGEVEEAVVLLRAALAETPANPALRAALAAATQAEQLPATLRFPSSTVKDTMSQAAPPPAPSRGRTGGEGARGGQRRNAPRPRSSSLAKVGPGVRLAETLRTLDNDRIAAFRDELDLLPKSSPAAARKELAAALKDEGTLRKALRSMPAEARRLLRSLVKLGGSAPAAAIFQIAGPEAPPPDFAQPLLDAGLLHLGTSPDGDEFIAAVPVDLLEPLAAALKSVRRSPA